MSHSVPVVVAQFAEDAAVLRNVRSTLVSAPHVKVEHLRRLDNRLAAHLDGLKVSGDSAWVLCRAALETPGMGQVFVATVRAIQDGRREGLDFVLAVAEAVSEANRGLISAFGWHNCDQLQGVVDGLLRSAEPFRRMIGIAACAVHRIDPGLASANRLQDESWSVRARAFRSAGELGQNKLSGAFSAAITDEQPECRFWAAWSAVLLGDRHRALDALAKIALGSGVQRSRSFRLTLQAMSPHMGHALLQQLADRSGDLRWLIQGIGISGDPARVPWLISHMRNDQTARLAGEAFTLIAGTDLPLLDLERPPPENFESGPNDDPDDSNVDMDPDESLPWPDVEKIEGWWRANGGRFQKGTRYFMGAPVTHEHCVDVLKNGYQRQRILAAHYLCLLDPGTPLFNTSAPAWRQQRLLAKMT